jgi:hypothetical protein
MRGSYVFGVIRASVKVDVFVDGRVVRKAGEGAGTS